MAQTTSLSRYNSYPPPQNLKIALQELKLDEVASCPPSPAPHAKLSFLSPSSRQARQEHLFKKLLALQLLAEEADSQLSAISSHYHRTSLSHKTRLRACSVARQSVIDASGVAQEAYKRAKTNQKLDSAFDDAADDTVANVSKKLSAVVRNGVLESSLMCEEFGAEKLSKDMLRQVGINDLKEVDTVYKTQGGSEDQDNQWDTLATELINRLSQKLPSISDRLPSIVNPLISTFRAIRLVTHHRLTSSVVEFEAAVARATVCVSEHQRLVRELDKGAVKLKDLKDLERRAEKELNDWDAETESVILALALLR